MSSNKKKKKEKIVIDIIDVLKLYVFEYASYVTDNGAQRITGRFNIIVRYRFSASLIKYIIPNIIQPGPQG